jgi:hypothetical protein
VGKENAHHFCNALLCSYEITTYWGGTVYSGMTLKWDFQKQTCNIFMPGYLLMYSTIFSIATQNIRSTHIPSASHLTTLLMMAAELRIEPFSLSAFAGLSPQ